MKAELLVWRHYTHFEAQRAGGRIVVVDLLCDGFGEVFCATASSASFDAYCVLLASGCAAALRVIGCDSMCPHSNMLIARSETGRQIGD